MALNPDGSIETTDAPSTPATSDPGGNGAAPGYTESNIRVLEGIEAMCSAPVCTLVTPPPKGCTT